MEEDNLAEATTICAPLCKPEPIGKDCNFNFTYAVQTISVENAALFIKNSVWSIDPPNGAECPPEKTTTASPDAGNNREMVFIFDRDCINNTLTVMRGWNGCPVNYAEIGTCIRMEFTVMPECPTFDGSPPVGRTTRKNYVQTLGDGYSTTKKFSLMQHYGVTDEIARHKARLMGGRIGSNMEDGILIKQLENALLRGKPNPGGSDGAHAAMGGIDSFDIPQYTLGGGLTPDRMCEFMQYVYEAGGRFSDGNYLFIMHPRMKSQISKWGMGQMANAMPGTTRWGFQVDSFYSDYGEVNFAMHHRLAPWEMYLLDTSKMGWIPIIPFEEGGLSQDSIWCNKYQILGAYTFALACRCHHAKFIVCPSCEDWECTGGCTTKIKPRTFCEPGVTVYGPDDCPHDEAEPVAKPTMTAEELLAGAKSLARGY